MTDIKFCGMTRPEDAEYAASLGAAYVGVIFAGGPRSLTLDRAKEVLANVPTAVGRVGVFSDQSADEIIHVAEHTLDGSRGYQVTGFFAPTHRF